jgi:hypothetical protein
VPRFTANKRKEAKSEHEGSSSFFKKELLPLCSSLPWKNKNTLIDYLQGSS